MGQEACYCRDVYDSREKIDGVRVRFFFYRSETLKLLIVMLLTRFNQGNIQS